MHSHTLHKRPSDIYSVYERIGTVYTCMNSCKEAFNTILVSWYEKEVGHTRGTIIIRKSKNVGQHNGQKQKDKRTNNDLQNTTKITKDIAIRTPLKPEMNSGAPES